MPFPLKLSDDGLAEIESVAAARWSIPTDKELARRHHVSISRIQQLMAAVRDRLKLGIDTDQREKKSPEFYSWRGMMTRCYNPNHDSFHNYGGRGIAVCERWHVFKNFLADMGSRPLDRTLDRIDNDGNYEQANCRWATDSEQALNRRPKLHIHIVHVLSVSDESTT